MSAEGKPWELEVSRRSDRSAAVVTVSGEVDAVTAPQLQSALDEALRDQPKVLVVDLSRVGFFGSAGLSVLLVAAEALPAGALRIVASEQVRRPIEVTGLDKMLQLFGDLEEALAGR